MIYLVKYFHPTLSSIFLSKFNNRGFFTIPWIFRLLG